MTISRYTQQEEKDVDIVFCFRSGEMHNMFVMMKRYGVTSEELSKRYNEIKKDKDYYAKISIWVNEKIEAIKKGQEQFVKCFMEMKKRRENNEKESEN
jgi:hypothetical protein